MNRNLSRSHIHRDKRANLIVSLYAAGALAGTAAPAHAGFYQQIDLNTDSNANLTALGYPATNNPDNPDLKNPWGISHSPTSPFWLSDNGAGKTTLYNGAGVKQGLVVTIATPPGQTPGTATPTAKCATGWSPPASMSRQAPSPGRPPSSSRPRTGRFRDGTRMSILPIRL